MVSKARYPEKRPALNPALTTGARAPTVGAHFTPGGPMESRRDFLRTLGIGAAAVAAGRPAGAQITQKRELVVAQGGDVSRLDPHMSTSSNDIRITFNLFDNLTNRHPDGSLAPGLATEWKNTAPTTWTFKLRPGVRFHN